MRSPDAPLLSVVTRTESSTPASLGLNCLRLLGLGVLPFRRAAVLSIALAAVLLVAGVANATNSPPAMIVPGQFNVSSTGAATYTIPIAVPPGSAGMVPALSLSYSSQSGDGIEGIGWTLSGLPSISRCPRTLAQDSVHGSVNYDTNDRLCMDGQRLIYVTGGTGYGTDGAQYRTEVESFSKVIEHNAINSSSVWFEVHTKSGQIMQFGNTADSQILTVGLTTNVVRAWAVNKISDTVGNYLSVTYNSNSDRTTYGEAYPIEIDYTGNAVAGVSPYNSVRFTYSGRSDSTPMYQAGALTQTTVLLTDIKTYQASNLVADYQLAYRAGTSTTHSRLTSVTLCDNASHCLVPTTFGWQGGVGYLTMASAISNPLPAAQDLHLLPGDFNGDGLTDTAITFTNPAACPPYGYYLGTQSSGIHTSPDGTISTNADNADFCTVGSQVQTILAPNGKSAVIIPIFARFCNHPDCMPPGEHDYNTVTVFANGSPSIYWRNGNISSYPNYVFPGDFNGDGYIDFFQQGTTTSYAYLYDPTIPGFSPDGGHSGLSPTTNTVATADFDGDGCTDILALTSTTNSTVYFCNPAVATGSAPSVTGFQVTLGDFNGDGKTDILLTSKTVAAQLWLSTGTGFVEANSAISSSSDWGKYAIYVGDWNGDGKADIMLVAPGGSGNYGSGTSHKLFVSTGTDFTAAVDSGSNPITISNSAATASATPADWNNDGATDIWIQQPTAAGGDTLHNITYTPELMASVSNGLGSATAITYDRLNKNGSFYTKGSSGTYPAQDIDGPLYVVSRVDASNGLGTCTPSVSYTNCYSSTYSYAGAQTNLQGRGFLGFASVSITDLQTNVIQTTNYSTAFPYIGMVTSQTKTHSGTTLSSITNTLANNSGCSVTPSTGVYFVCLTQNVAASNDLNGAGLPTVTTSYTYDSYGNALTVNVSVSDGSSKNTTNTYSNDTTNWYLGRLLTTAVNSVVGSSNLTRHSSFSYDSSTGLLNQEVVESGVSTCNSGSSSCTVTTTYTYDAFGHRVTTTVSGSGITSRASYAYYDANGEFQTAAMNALGQYEFWAYDARFGLPTSHTGPNNLTTTWTYDSFGRGSLETRPDGTKTSQSYAYCSGIGGGSASCPTYGTYLATAQIFAPDGTTQIGPTGSAFYDMLSRNIANDNQGFDGSSIRAATQYDGNGRVQQTSRPYFTSGGSPRWTSFTYDDLGRVTQATFPDASHTTYVFNGLTTSTTNNLNQTTTTLKNAQGLAASVTDPASHATAYVYDAFGNPLTVTDPTGNVVTNTFDIRGRKVTSHDPDMGSWTYAYDVLGELTSQVDAKSQTTTITYDLLGRVVSRTESSLFSTWTYGTSPANHNVGQLIEAQACTASGCSTLVSDRTFVYDSLGRPSITTLHTPADYFGYYTSYNSNNGKIDAVTYPSGFAKRSVYNTYGYLCSITNTVGTPTCTTSGGASIYWSIANRDAELHLTQSVSGNGVGTQQAFDPDTGLIQSLAAGALTGPTWGSFNWNSANWGGTTVAALNYKFDTIGNLTTRTDTDAGYSEGFCYDALNRLTGYGMGGSCSSSGAKTVSYDAIGNISAKSDTGTYSYPSSGSSSVRPHAISQITGTVNGVTNPYYTYDANGNLTCTSTGSACTGSMAQTVTMTSFNMASVVAQGSNSASFTYDSEHARIQQISIASGVTTTTVYLNDPASGAMSERVTTGTNAPIWTDYLTVDGQIVAQRKIQYETASAWGAHNWNSFNWGPPPGNNWNSFNWGAANWSGPVVTWAFFTLDHLGSVAVITDQGGNVVQRLSYDAWGKQRNSNGTDAACGSITSSTTRGFTNQEEVNVVCLVNLNARLYDPTIGKFLAPDPIVGDANVPNAFNRYAYVLNNPLSFTDPSGLCFLGCFWNSPIFRDILGVALIAFGQPELSSLEAAAGLSTVVSPAILAAANGAIIGGAVAGISGGNVLKGALFGGLGAGLAAGPGVTLGSTLGRALLSETGIGAETASYIGGAIAQGAVGGLTSVAEGGNFGSGFLAAGIGSLGGSLSGGQFEIGNLAASAALGGVGSVFGGGKFANGAITGAFAYAASASYANDNNPSSSDAIHGARNPGAGQSGIPDSLVILNPSGDYHGSSADFTLQLIDTAGKPITSPGYALEEDVFPDNGPGSNSNYQFTPSPNGQWTDTVGFGPFSPGTPPQRASVTQSFTVEYNNNFYPLSTQTEHLKFFDNGKYTFKDVITHK